MTNFFSIHLIDKTPERDLDVLLVPSLSPVDFKVSFNSIIP